MIRDITKFITILNNYIEKKLNFLHFGLFQRELH